MNAFPYTLYAGTEKKYASDKVILGDTGIETSRMAMGTGTQGYRKSSAQTRQLGIKGLSDLLRAGFDEGITFWDSADGYGSHPHLKEALKYVPREEVVILTKTGARTEKRMKEDLDRFRQEIGTDYLDIVLLHCMWNSEWPEERKGAMEVLSRAREDGIVRAHGISQHNFGALQVAAGNDWVQVDMARINPYGKAMDDEVPKVVEVLEKMKSRGKGLIGMKIFAQGELVDKKDECLQYTLNKELVDSFTIGSEDHGELKDLIKSIPEASVRG